MVFFIVIEDENVFSANAHFCLAMFDDIDELIIQC